MKYNKPDWLTFKNPYLFTIFSLGFFIGFWLGFFVFAQVHVIVVCQPSGRTLLDTRRSLNHEFVLSTEVSGCERIDMVISKPKFIEMFSRKEDFSDEKLGLNEKTSIPDPTRIESLGQIGSEKNPTSLGLPSFSKAPNGTRILTLDVFGICSGKSDIKAQYFGTSEKCFVKDILPYYIVFDVNTTSISTRFYEGVGFTETYNSSDYVMVFRLFAKDLSTIDDDVKFVKLYGPMAEYFEIGDYLIEEVSGPEKKEKVVSFPLFIKGEIPKTGDWSYLSFYLYMSNNIYYIGDVWFFVS